MSTHSIDAIANAICVSWSSATSQDADAWRPDRPSHGQCAVTSLLLQELVGGDIERVFAVQPDGECVSHWRNRIDGKIVDLTSDQFGSDVTFEPREGLMAKAEAQAYAFTNEATRARFSLLKSRVQTLLTGA